MISAEMHAHHTHLFGQGVRVAWQQSCASVPLSEGETVVRVETRRGAETWHYTLTVARAGVLLFGCSVCNCIIHQLLLMHAQILNLRRSCVPHPR